MNNTARVRILIAEPFELTRRGIHQVLSSSPDFEVIADIRDVRDAPAHCQRDHPDVSVIGVTSKEERAERHAALNTIADIVAADEWARIVVITDVTSLDDLVEPVRAGARAVVGRHAAEEMLRTAITTVSEGHCFLGDCLTQLLFDYLSGRGVVGDKAAAQIGAGTPSASALTVRENEVMAELVHGYRTSEIADHLGVTPATVKTHVRQICRKLNVRGRTAAILKTLNLQTA